MKKSFLIFAAVVVVVGAIVGGIALAHGKPAVAAACSKPAANAESHEVMIMDDKVDNPNIQAKLCDTITFTNMDSIAREIAFGPHEHHVPYDGVAEKVLSLGQSFTITLNQAGNFHWHDHLHDQVQGYFTVKT